MQIAHNPINQRRPLSAARPQAASHAARQCPSQHRSSAAAAVAAYVGDLSFPCVGAKTALAKGQIEVFRAGSILDASHDSAILAGIEAFIQAYTVDKSLFRSFFLQFSGPDDLDEASFEAALWQRLQALHALDQHSWDPAVSDDPAHANFSYSLGGKGFYLVGLHPGSSRQARRFEHPAIVFNLHEQFERLRADGSYQTMRKLIRRRDIALSGSTNPMLEDFGERSEARQYSGRAVGSDWKCPFKHGAAPAPSVPPLH